MGTYDLLGGAVQHMFTKSDLAVREAILQRRSARSNQSRNLQHELEFALTLMLVDIASCDDPGMSRQEYQVILDAVRNVFKLGVADVQQLVTRAQTFLARNNGIESYVKLLRDNLPEDARRAIQREIEEIVRADGVEDGFERYFALKYEKLLGLDPLPTKNS